MQSEEAKNVLIIVDNSVSQIWGWDTSTGTNVYGRVGAFCKKLAFRTRIRDLSKKN